jgi:purine-binding chemotaxis protein CheW
MDTHAHEANTGAHRDEHREFLSFRLGKEHYGIDLLKVQEVRRYEVPTKMPHCSPSLLGVLDIRGDITPVWDARLALGMHDATFSAHTVTVLLTLDQQRVGLVVDEVSDIARVHMNDIQPVRAGGSALKPEQLLGVTTVRNEQGSHVLILLDADKLAQTQGAAPRTATVATH